MHVLLWLAGVFGALLILGIWWTWYSPKARKKNAQHQAVWGEYLELDTHGFSRLQRECEAVVLETPEDFYSRVRAFLLEVFHNMDCEIK